MQCGHRLGCERPKQRQMQVLDVEMQHVEFGGVRAHTLEHQQVMGQGIVHPRVEAQRAWRAGDQARGCLRVGAGEQGHVVP